MKMIQTETTFGRPNVEIFYDGQLNVVYDGTYGVVNIPPSKVHWSDQLLLRGYVVMEEKVETEAQNEPFVPIQKRKAKNG